MFDDFETAAKYVRDRLKEKGYPLEIQWGTKKIKKVTLIKCLNEAAASTFDTKMEDLELLDEHSLRQKLSDLKTFRKLLKQFPEPKRLDASLSWASAKAHINRLVAGNA